MKNSILLLTGVIILALTLSSCDKGNQIKDYAHFGFNESETIIEVDENVTSFKIEGEFTPDAYKEGMSNPGVLLDTDKTTAKHKIHFIHTPGVKNNFLQPFIISEGQKVYYEVKIIPENITEEVKIVYWAIIVGEPEDNILKNLILETTIILRPKKAINN